MSFVTKENTEDIYPLSPTQQGMLFHSVLDDKSPVYFEQFSFTINGSLDVEAFSNAWSHMVTNTPVFRTVFKWAKVKDPLQIVLKKIPVPIQVHDLTDLDEAAQEQSLVDFLSQDKTHLFNLEQGPLMRMNLFKLGPDKNHFVWSHHHIIIDGWCLPIILKDLFDSYLAYLAGNPPPRPARRSYKDYIAWYFKQDKDKALAFWRDQLGDFIAKTPLPYDRSHGQDVADLTSIAHIDLGEELTTRLLELTKKERITQSTLVQSAWAILLARYNNLEDVVFGVTVSGRPADLRGSEEMLGLFINTLPVRVKFTDDMRVAQLLQDVQGLSLAIRDYEYSFLPDIKSVSGIFRDQNLFDSIVVFENFPIESAVGVKDSSFGISDFRGFEMTNFPLTMIIVPGASLGIDIHYYQSLFDESTIHRMLGHLANIIDCMVREPEQSIAAIDILSESERSLVLEEFNATDRPYDLSKCTCQMFEAQAAKTPDHIAVTAYSGQSLTYGELNARTNQLARFLRRCGVGVETMVAMMLDRSIEMEIALLGINKAGGAYVPMGTDYPETRVDYILKDTQAPVVLVQEKYAPMFANRDIKVVCLDTGWAEIAGEDAGNLEAISGSENLAYVLYTSGSTGIPKGVACLHKGLTNRLIWMQEAYRIKEDDCILQKTPYTFDVSGWEFHWPMMYGARLHFLKPEAQKDPQHIMDIIREQGVTTLHFVPSMLYGFLQIVDDENKADLSSLRRVICSGEALLTEHRDLFFSYLNCELHNLYGPTEAAIDVTYYTLKPTDTSTFVPIGKPLANTRVYILNRHMQPVPVGVPGEICLAGVQLARGYVNKPEKTAEVFIDHSIGPDSRLYKTGDLGKWMPDGNIEYLGRIDYQVKIRGNRVELGEVESALCRYEGVHECVVVDKTDSMGSKYLVGYYAADKELPVDAVRTFLKNALPEYMVPTRFMCMENLPLNPNGKVDRKALPDVENVRPDMDSVYVKPSTDIQRALVQVWKEVLGVERVGINDNFFDLGGHSLLIMKVIAKLKMAYPLAVQDFFDYQTVDALALRIEEKLAASLKSEAPVAVQEETFAGVRVDVPLSGRMEQPREIFLTGATGYLGAYVLRELLDATEARIYCLIRGADERQCLDKLESVLTFYFGDEMPEKGRIVAVPGDIAVDGLGLCDEMARRLLKVDTVVHAAADVRHFGKYSHFHNVNVLGTARLLDLARSGACRRFHYISTLSITGDSIPGMSKVFFKETDYNRGQSIENVYARSKFEAEGLVREAMAEGMSCTIFRVGNLVGNAVTGKFQRSIETSAFYGLMQAIVHMGVIPEGSGNTLDMTPVDFCSRALVGIMLLPETMGHCLHLYNPHLSTFQGLARIIQDLGYPMRIIPVEEYVQSLQTAQKSVQGKDAVERLVPHLEGALETRTTFVFDQSYERYFLDSIGFEWPALDRELVGKLLEYCASIGFIVSPQETVGE